MDTRDFLQTVITAEEGYFCLGIASQDGTRWLEQFFQYPQDMVHILEAITKRFAEHNLYFSTYLFATPQSTKSNVLPTRTIQADLDHADIDSLSIQPTVLVETSPGRHQGYWVLSETQGLEQHEFLSKKLTYSIPLCDLSGWPLGRKVRLPGSLNFKYLDGPKPVTVKKCSGKNYEAADLELLPDVPPALSETFDEDWLTNPPEDMGIGPRELLAAFKSRIPAKVYSQYNTVATGREGRSGALWALMCAAFRAGANRDQVYWLAKHSANNKFVDLRFHGGRELCKDVLRAEQLVRSRVVDERAAILDARKLPGANSEKRRHIFNLVQQYMKDSGEFINTANDAGWYIRRDLGRPIRISRRSEYLDSLLDLQFGLNATEPEQSYVAASLTSYLTTLDPSGIQASLSYYHEASRQLFLHTGKRDILSLTATSVSTSSNGTYGIVFPWQAGIQPFIPDGGIDYWPKVLFGDLDNIINMEPREALVLLQVWFLFLLFRSAAVSRPILAAFGQPGAGKSTLFRRVYALLYGRHKSIGSITTPEDFDHAVASDPFVALDNVDTWERWLPDRLALSAATSDIIKRKLYTDADIVTVKRQALVGITAHNPKFGREDVADRLLLLTFQRLPRFLPEGEIIDSIIKDRNKIWGAILKDCQRILATPSPTSDEVPQFRVEDFARVGYWIATGVGKQKEFSDLIGKLKGVQHSFSIEEEQLLIVSLRSFLQKKSSNGKVPHEEWKTAGQWWSVLETCSSDPQAFNKSYRNAVNLGKKLWSLQDTLKEIFEVEWKVDSLTGTRVWRISPKPPQ